MMNLSSAANRAESLMMVMMPSLASTSRGNPKPPFLSDQMSEVEHGEKAGESVTFALLRPL